MDPDPEGLQDFDAATGLSPVLGSNGLEMLVTMEWSSCHRAFPGA